MDGNDTGPGISFCFPDGPGETPGSISGYFPLPGMSLWIDGGSKARITSPDDTVWHPLAVELSASVVLPALDTQLATQPAWATSFTSGHVLLQGEGPHGPVTIDADFALGLGVSDACAPPPPRID